jgi:hypothetical protein
LSKVIFSDGVKSAVIAWRCYFRSEQLMVIISVALGGFKAFMQRD